MRAGAEGLPAAGSGPESARVGSCVCVVAGISLAREVCGCEEGVPGWRAVIAVGPGL